MNDDLEALKEAIQHTEAQPRDEQGKLTPEGQQAVQDKLGQKDSLSPVEIKQAVGEFMDALTQMIAEEMGESGQEPIQEEPPQDPSGPQGKSLDWRDYGRGLRQAYGRYGHVYTIYRHPSGYHSLYMLSSHGPPSERVDTGDLEEMQARANQHEASMRNAGPQQRRGTPKGETPPGEVGQQSLKSLKSLNWRETSPGTHFTMADNGAYRIHQGVLEHFPFDPVTTESGETQTLDRGKNSNTLKRVAHRHHQDTMREARTRGLQRDVQQGFVHQPGQRPLGEMGQQSLKSLGTSYSTKVHPGTEQAARQLANHPDDLETMNMLSDMLQDSEDPEHQRLGRHLNRLGPDRKGDWDPWQTEMHRQHIANSVIRQLTGSTLRYDRRREGYFRFPIVHQEEGFYVTQGHHRAQRGNFHVYDNTGGLVSSHTTLNAARRGIVQHREKLNENRMVGSPRRTKQGDVKQGPVPELTGPVAMRGRSQADPAPLMVRREEKPAPREPRGEIGKKSFFGTKSHPGIAIANAFLAPSTRRKPNPERNPFTLRALADSIEESGDVPHLAGRLRRLARRMETGEQSSRKPRRMVFGRMPKSPSTEDEAFWPVHLVRDHLTGERIILAHDQGTGLSLIHSHSPIYGREGRIAGEHFSILRQRGSVGTGDHFLDEQEARTEFARRTGGDANQEHSPPSSQVQFPHWAQHPEQPYVNKRKKGRGFRNPNKLVPPSQESKPPRKSPQNQEIGKKSVKSLRGKYKATPAPLPSLNPGDRVFLHNLPDDAPPSARAEREVTRTEGVRSVSGHPERRQVRARARVGHGREVSLPVDWLRRVGSDPSMNARRRLISLHHHVGLDKDTPNAILADKLRDAGLDEHADWVQSYHPSGTIIHREGNFLVTQSPSSPYLSIHKVSDRNSNYGYPHTVVPTLEQAQQYIRSRSGQKSFFGTKSVIPPQVHSKSLVMSSKAWRWTHYDDRQTVWPVQEGITPIGTYGIFRDRDTGMHQLMWIHRPADRNRPDYGAGPFLVGEHQDPTVLRTMAREHFRRVSKAPPPGPQQMAGTRKGERPPGEIGQASLKGLNMSTKAHPAVGMIRQFKQGLRSGTPDLQSLHIIADSLEESGHQRHAERLRDLTKFYSAGGRHGTSGRSIKNALDDAAADVSGKARKLRWRNINWPGRGFTSSATNAGHGHYSVREHRPYGRPTGMLELNYLSHQPEDLKEEESRSLRGEILHVHSDPKVLQRLAREHNESPEVVKLPRPH